MTTDASPTPETTPLSLVPPPALVIPPGMAAPTASHEHELVSALLDTGEYKPRAYGVPKEAFRGNAGLNEFCLTYQEQAGVAPPVSIVRQRFPSFTYVEGLSASWAAHQVLQDETERGLRKTLSRAASAVSEESYGEAVGILREAVTSFTTASTPGRLVTDFAGTRATGEAEVCPVPPGHLATLTGGHRAGQYWLWAALWGVGKTFKLIEHSVIAAESGWDVIFFSMEMPTEDILTRMRRQALRGRDMLEMADLDRQEKAMNEWAEGCGTIEVRGPDAGRVDASVVAAAVTHPKTLVVMDYIGKMFSTDGRHAKSTQNGEVIALISAELQQTAGMLKVPILGAAQINRQGQLAGSIGLEQDADIIINQQRIADHVNGVRKNTIYKTRFTELPPPWYSRFSPSLGRFDDISHEEAMKIRMAEETSVWS